MTTPPANRAALALSALALTVSVAGVGGPVVAAAFDARNADKVDGRHAVVAKAKPAQRKGKVLAAHPRTGRLPDNIIRRAPDAARLGGVPAAEVLDRYTRAEVDAKAGSHLLGYGTVGSDGALSETAYLPGGTSGALAGSGSYYLRLPGFSPGCERPLPLFVGTAHLGPGHVHLDYAQPNCATGDVTVYVQRTNASGTPVAGAFTFALYAPPAPSP